MKRKSNKKQRSATKMAKAKSRRDRKPVVASGSSPMPEMSTGEVVIYRAPDGRVRLDVHLTRETVWLTQAQMTLLFGRERSVVTKHINNVFTEGELTRKSNVQILHIASSD